MKIPARVRWPVLALVLLLVLALGRREAPRPGAGNPIPRSPSALPAGVVALTGTAAATPSVAHLQAWQLRPRVVRMDWGFLEDPASPVHNGDRREAIPIELYPDVRVNVHVEAVRHLEPGVFTVTGRTDAPLSLVVLAKVRDKVVATVVDPDHGEFTLEPTADPAWTRIYQVDQSALVCGPELPADGETPVPAGSPVIEAPVLAEAPPHREAVPDGPLAEAGLAGNETNDFWSNLSPPTAGTRIPVLGAYSAEMAAKAVALYGSLDGLRARLETGLALTSAALQRAGSPAYLQLVGFSQITLTEGNDPDLLNSLSLLSRAPEYASLQNKYRPALTILVSGQETTTISGRGQNPGRLSVLTYDVLNSTLTPHEFGHNFGMSHNIEDASSPNSRAYGYGWRIAATSPAVGDIMSYFLPGSTMFRLPLYSDPTSSFRGMPLGSVEVADNARVAREMTATTAGYTSFQFGSIGDNWMTALATRGFVGTGEQVLIAGLIISGNTPKQVALRGAGPSLAAAGVQQALANPQLELYSGSTRVAVNDDWQSHSRAADLLASGLAPTHTRDAGMLVTLNPGAYTVILSGVDGATGIGLVESYEMDAPMSRFRYWNSNNVSSSFSEGFNSPIEFEYDFSTAAFRNRPVLYQLTSTSAARLLLVSRGDPSGASPSRDPYLQIIRVPTGVNPYTFSRATIVAANDSWGTLPEAADLRRSGILGLNDAGTAAVLVEVTPGADYYVSAMPGDPNQHLSGLVSGKVRIAQYNVTGTENVGLENRLAAVSTRGVVGTGERVMIAGIIVKGSTSRTVFVRVAGPSLAAFGIQNAVANPRLTIYDSRGQAFATNDNWQTDANGFMLQQWGAAPVDANEPALVLTLAPGAYTVIADNNGPEGVANIEVYELR